jgi:LysR family glycine cleavage system transcriptional activator
MRRKIPSTAALSAFEAAARHQSFTRAADELAVTQGAICRQIATLEEFLKVKLFRRSQRGVSLTEAGLAYSRKVAARLDEVERDTLDMMARGGQGGTLELGVVPTFATRWLLPRLRGFIEEHQDIIVNMTPRARPFLFDQTPFDAAIHAGEAVWPGTEGVFLMRERMIAVCSPALAPASDAIDWDRHTLLQMSTRPYAWRNWFASLGVDVERDMAGPRFELFSMVAEAAAQGIGIGLIPRMLVEDELRRGVLVQMGRHEAAGDRSYYLIYPEHRSDDKVLAAFRNWLERDAAAYRASQGLA